MWDGSAWGLFGVATRVATTNLYEQMPDTGTRKEREQLLVERVQELEVLLDDAAGRSAELGDILVVLPVIAIGFGGHRYHVLDVGAS
jgi:hypothetical protein